MDIIIIEDERITAEDLKETILNIEPNANIVKVLSSVKEAVHYFQHHPLPQLIFSDIQLGDGLSFEIYNQIDVKVPIIFCTAFDEYALMAFETNGIHYLLKPFDESKIAEALDKYKNLQSAFSIDSTSIMKVLETLQKPIDTAQSILVFQQDKVIPVKFKDIAIFFIKNEVTHLLTFSGKTYYINKSLDIVQQMCGDDFYRANRQFIINRESIKEVSHTTARKVSVELSIPFSEGITVSKEKMTEFLEWLQG